MNVCRDTSDAVALYLPQRLYLKPTAKINISVQLPPVKVHGKSISNWELMEKLRKMIQPETFSALKVSKNSSDVIRFDAEIDNREKLERVISRLDDHTVKLNDYPDALKVRACEAKVDFPSRHAWDAFFRDAPNMDEMKPGERPDTVYLANLPIKWFVNHRNRNDDDAVPNESIFRKVFEKFGKVRQVDVPLADPFRKDMKPHMTGMQAHGGDSQVFFEGYVQFSEYVAFVRAMDALRGMKLLQRGEELAESAAIAVDFDKTKHMTDAAVKRRAIVRDRLAERQRARAEKEKEEKDKIAKKEERERLKAEWSERQKLEGMQEREEKRKKKQLAKLMARERGDVRSKVAEEERRLVTAQRRLQAVRLMEELFRRIDIKHVKPKKDGGGRERSARNDMEANMRERIVRRIKCEQEAEMDKQRQRLQRAYEGSIVLRAVLDTKKPRARSPSASSVSSAGSSRALEHERERSKRVKKEKMTTPEREQEMHRAAMYPAGIAAPYGIPYQFPAPAYTYQPPPPNMYYGMGRGYYAPPVDSYTPRPRFPVRRGRGRPLYRGGPRMPYFEGPNASHDYYKYFKRLSEAENASEHDDRTRSRSRSRRRSYTRSRSRSRYRRYSRSRSRSSRSRSRSKSRRRRSYSRSRSRRRTHSRSRSHKSHGRRSRSRSRRSRSRSRSKRRSQSPKKLQENSVLNDREYQKQDDSQPVQNSKHRSRSKSWSLPKQTEKTKSWSKSPSKEQ